MHVRFVGLSLLALAACATPEYTRVVAATELPDAGPRDAGAPDAGPPPAAFDLSALRTEAQALVQAQSDLLWKNWTTGAPVDLAGTYAGHTGLFSLETIARVQAAERAEADPEKRRALTDLELYLAGEHIAQETASVSGQVASLEGSATLSFEGAEIPFRNLDALLANEHDHARRLALYAAATPVLAKLNPLLEKREARTEEVVGELGYGSYAALGARMRDADLAALAAQAEALLTQTDALYTRALGAAVHQELNLDLSEMRRADVPRFFHAASVQSAFPAAQMLPRFTALLAGMGIDLAQLKLTLDAAPTPHKNPRAVCFAVKVPDDVRLSIKPSGGADDYAQLFHEGGHALAFASTTTPVWEFQQLGNATVAEAFGFLFEDRLEDPAYLKELGMTGELLHGWVKNAAVRKLYMLRRYAAKVLLEQAWHGPAPLSGAPLRARYRELMQRALGFPVTDEDAARTLTDHDDFFYSADYLRAWFLAAQLDQALAQKYGAAWWHAPEAGKQLRALMASGSGLTADQVAQAVGQKGLDPAPLLQRLNERLR
jgi:hypothetical protein